MITWNFPNNGNGQIRGIADAGMEAFRAGRIKALAREICQNSLDAAINEDACVEVEFEHATIQKEDVPGYIEVKEAIDNASFYWESQPSEDAKRFLRKALKTINNSMLVLRIGDYNTHGLSDPYNLHSMNGWNSLTRLDGGATKSGDKAGSFGIGKNAPFVNSALRMVFYRTLNEAGEYAAQGMIRALSFPKNGNVNHMTTGFGYYGDNALNMPVQRIPELERLNRRTDVGTDVFIYGFNPSTESKQSWLDDIKLEILSNFFMAIYRNKLSVRFRYHDTGRIETIDAKTIGLYACQYEKFDKNMFNTYCLISNPKNVKAYEYDFHGLGTLHLQLLTDNNKALNRKVLVIRKSGMKLFLKDRISTIVNFTGILELKGFKLNEFFRKMETPEHDKWEPDRHIEPTKAKKYVKEIWDWVQQQVANFADVNIGEELEVKGLEGLLQDNNLDYTSSIKTVEKETNRKKEGIQYRPLHVDVEERPIEHKNKGVLYTKDYSKSGNGTDKTKQESGRITNDGLYGVMRTLKGTRKRNSRESHKGVSDPDGQDILNKPIGHDGKVLPLQFVRLMKIDGAKYRLLFTSPASIKHGHIDLVTVGENGQNVALEIKDVQALGGVEKAIVKDGSIYFSHMWSTDRVKLEFTIVDNKEYAMEVHAYEDY